MYEKSSASSFLDTVSGGGRTTWAETKVESQPIRRKIASIILFHRRLLSGRGRCGDLCRPYMLITIAK
ncbi:hypothetical protein ACLOJK_007445 [Asimina triloba]